MAIEFGQWVEYHPLSSLTDSAPIEFLVSGTPEYYLDLSNTFLHVKARVLKSNGNQLGDDDVCAPTNLFIHTLFNQVDVSLGSVLVSSSNYTYSYRAYLEMILCPGNEQKYGRLSAAFWCRNTAGVFNSTTTNGDEAGINRGFMKWKTW